MYNANKNENEILKFWDKNKTFEKSVESRPADKPYVFYDGPPFATGLPHYGHILSSLIKDVVPRYWTMKGYRVRRRWGWDCHGMPIENIVEKELKISGKKDIEEKLGVDKFNKTCESKVLTYTQDWKKMINRIGRWVEFDNAYKTMDSTYMESVWWALKTIWDKNLIYEGKKVLMYCPRCETPVSKAEISMDDSYKDITEETLIAKFKIKNSEKHNLPKNTFILAWTTTPWTLPGNVALAVGNDIDYVLVEGKFNGNEYYICAKDRLGEAFKSHEKKHYLVEETFKGSDLVGLEYEPLFDISAIHETGKKAWYVTDADFVTTEEGTGIVHTAVVYGEDDYNLGLERDLPVVPLLDDKGHFNELSPELIKGKYFKGAEKDIKNDLESRGLIFERANHTHSYPHCWRCDTQLFYNAISAWFINIQEKKKKIIKLNEKINWYPDHLKHGRFLNILETAPDWNISRNRFWATPLPFWKCNNVRTTKNTNIRTTNGDCDNVVCIGSVDELKKRAINFDEVYKTDKIEEMDLHKHMADKIKLKCDKCSGEMSRIPEVIDCWVESASMPFAEFHFPFENEEIFKKRFPGQYIAEYIAQTRAWFYYMHVMAVLLFDDISFENCVTTGTILNEKGEKLSKSKMNYTDPWKIIEEYGVDALRFYLMTSVVMQADNLYFNDREVRDVYNKVVNILWNVYTFYDTFADQRGNDTQINAESSNNVLDKWILAKLNILVKEVTEEMDNYNTVKAGRPIKDFIDDLSTWYVRRSRDRFKEQGVSDKEFAISTLREVLLTLSKVMAPFTPFIAESIYKGVRNKEKGVSESVHLEKWPEIDDSLIDDKVINDMERVRKIVEMGHSLRKEAGIPVRQPLNELRIITHRASVSSENCELSSELAGIIADELNVKNVEINGDKEINGDNIITKEDGGLKVGLNTEITSELKKEGLVREIVRAINQMRKDQGLTINDEVTVEYHVEDELLKSIFEQYADEIKKQVLARDLVHEKIPLDESDDVVKKIDGKEVLLAVKVG
ncbi:isoleucine--tRNA ligase [Patescibacteria group bacterium]|nr:isoleucine--tRNA ligase [Patescibacteria group bacterium]